LAASHYIVNNVIPQLQQGKHKGFAQSPGSSPSGIIESIHENEASSSQSLVFRYLEGRILYRRINKIPKWARQYIHELHSTVPSAGDVQTMAELRDQVRGLSCMVVELQRELKQKSRR